jgi:hypothetical protein
MRFNNWQTPTAASGAASGSSAGLLPHANAAAETLGARLLAERWSKQAASCGCPTRTGSADTQEESLPDQAAVGCSGDSDSAASRCSLCRMPFGLGAGEERCSSRTEQDMGSGQLDARQVVRLLSRAGCPDEGHILLG